MQLHIRRGSLLRVGDLHESGQQGMGEPESRGRKVIGNRGIDVAGVSRSEASAQGLQVARARLALAQDNRHELAVGDVLHLGADDAPRLLVHLLVVPLGIELGEAVGQPVMLARPEQVHRRQMEILVGPRVTRGEAVSTAHQLELSVAAVLRVRAGGEQLPLVRGRLHAQPPARELAQTLRRVHVRAVDRRAVDERRHLRISE